MRAAVLLGVLVLLGAAMSACGGLQTGTRLDIVATEYAFDPATVVLDAHTIGFSIRNQGQIEHDFELIGADGVVTHVEAIQPGLNGGVSITVKPGSYRFVCTIEDHAQRGMSGTLTVR